MEQPDAESTMRRSFGISDETHYQIIMVRILAVSYAVALLAFGLAVYVQS